MRPSQVLTLALLLWLRLGAVGGVLFLALALVLRLRLRVGGEWPEESERLTGVHHGGRDLRQPKGIIVVGGEKPAGCGLGEGRCGRRFMRLQHSGRAIGRPKEDLVVGGEEPTGCGLGEGGCGGGRSEEVQGDVGIEVAAGR